MKYALFPPLGLATLAGHLRDDDDVTLTDEHVESLDEDDDPELVVLQTYVTSARRAYEIADRYRRKGAHVALGGLHPTSLPDEAAAHADSVFLGPGDDTWPEFLADFRAGRPRARYESRVRTLDGLPKSRRDLIKRHLYLVPNSLVVSRGCPHACAFCYKEAFFAGGRGFYTERVGSALAEIERLPGRHLYFLDDHLFGDPRFAAALCDGLSDMGRLWQAAGTVASVLRPGLMARASRAGLRSLFVGFETLRGESLRAQHKHINVGRDYAAAVHRLHDLGIMVNASFVFGMDGDGPDVFERTVEWALGLGIETATFHVLTPYPGTALLRQMASEGRLLHRDWDLYDTRHAVFEPRGMTAAELEAGYWRAYRDFYRWGSILRAAATKPTLAGQIRHAAYAGGWKKLEPLWDLVIRSGLVGRTRPVLERVLDAAQGAGSRRPGDASQRCHMPVTSLSSGGPTFYLEALARHSSDCGGVMKNAWIAAVAVCLAATTVSAEPMSIDGAGATFPYPIYSKWFAEYNKMHPDIQINYQSIGSGGGIRQLTNQTVFFGASDGPMNDAQLKAAPMPILHFPTVLGGVVPAYNLPGVTAQLRFTGEILADIVLGKITRWNDPALVKQNPGVKLPDTEIVVVHRADGSGTTYIFVDYLSKVSSEFKQKVGVNTSVAWPVGVGAKGNEGVAGLVKQTPGALGYVELIYALQNNILYGSVRNLAGEWVRASLESVTAAAAGAAREMPADFRVSITNAAGKGSYPISSFTWLLLQQDPKDKARAATLVGFVKWALSDGQRYCAGLGYAPLPANVVKLEIAALAKIKL